MLASDEFAVVERSVADARTGRDVDTFAAVVAAPCQVSDLSAVSDLRASRPELPLIVVPERSSEALAIAAVRAGANDYLKGDLQAQTILDALRRCVPRHSASDVAPVGSGTDRMIGSSRRVRSLIDYARRVAATDSSVLIVGETGTGKELLARLIHEASRRRGKAFVCVNCAAVPDQLVESEFFGHERGAFTGATSSRAGKLSLASGGTLFLDEVGDMKLDAQAKILRALESRQIQRVGGSATIDLDLRLIAATNRDLQVALDAGSFRPDLYYRLNVIRLELPPLRERKDDIPDLCRHFIRTFNRRFQREVDGISPEALESLLQRPWAGNVRELKNTIEAAFANVERGRIQLADLQRDMGSARPPGRAAGSVDRSQLLAALVETNWNMTRAARRLNCSRMTVYRKVAKYHIVREGKPRRETPGEPGV